MMQNQTFVKFRQKQDKAATILKDLQRFVFVGKELGVNIDSSVHHKLDNVVDLIGTEGKLKVALIGGFSEGKTSIAAAWAEKYDKSTMNISQEESSNAVHVYSIDDDIELIDTPGLFGFKEKYNNESGAIEKYKSITKKYISEAHLALYVMDSANPIKESHSDDLVWLFRTLNLLPRTIFVLSRFDEVADIEDEWDYHDNLKIKKQNVVSRLTDVITLTSKEEDLLQIVGVSANPFGMGTEYWLENIEQFKTISKIDTLQQATTKVMDNNGGYFPIVYEMQKSIIEDVLLKHLDEAKKEAQQINEVINAYEENCDSMGKNIKAITGRINEVQSNLINYIVRYFADLIRQIRGCGMDTIQAFLEAEIGKEGCVMYANLQNEFSRQTRTVDVEIEKTALEFKANMDHFDSTIGVLGGEGLNLLKNCGAINAKNVIGIRDGIVGLGKMLGADLSSMLKFKPWGAVKLANNLAGVLAFAGLAVQVYDEYKRVEAEKKFKEAVTGMVSDFENTRKELLELVQCENFPARFFPEYIDLCNLQENEKNKIEAYKEKQNAFTEWCVEGERIASEYNVLD